MAVRTIRVYPDPILKQVAEPVAEIDESVAGVVKDLVDTMLDAGHSVGVAAPQIGVLQRIVVVDVSKSKLGKENNHGLLEMINPAIIDGSGSKVMREGCMSVPDYTGNVIRATRIKLRAQTLTGESVEYGMEGFEAVHHDSAASRTDKQAEIMELLQQLCESEQTGLILITHDLGVVSQVTETIAVMYAGKIVEAGPTDRVVNNPRHPYTQALLAEAPRLETDRRIYAPIKGEIPSPLNPPSGCHFHPRCPHATERCRTEVPKLKEIAPGRVSACHLNDG